MALYTVCLRRSLSHSSSLLHRNLHHLDASRRISTLLSSNPCLSSSSSNLEAAAQKKIKRPCSDSCHMQMQWFRFLESSTGSLPWQKGSGLLEALSQRSYGEILPSGSICYSFDGNHWRIEIGFPKYERITREQMVETYVRVAAKVFGSVEEAKKRIYSYYTYNYCCFMVECSRETSYKFRGLPEVRNVDADYSYRKAELKKKNRIAESKKRVAELKMRKRMRMRMRMLMGKRTFRLEAQSKNKSF